jgi:tRNA/rRNA methyltransferase
MLPDVEAEAASVTTDPEPATAPLADAQQLAGLLDHWQTSLKEIGFLDPEAPKKLMPRLNQLFNRAQVTQEEIHILRGIAKAMSQVAHSAGQQTPPHAVSKAAI